MDNLSDKNQQRAGRMMLLFASLLAALSIVVLFLLELWIGIVSASVVAFLFLLVFAGLSATAERRILSSLRVRAVHKDKYPRLSNLVEGLCLATGVSTPEILIIPSETRNVAAIGRHAHRSALVVTTGLLESTSRIGLEAALANRLSQIASGKSALATAAVTSFGIRIGVSTLGFSPSIFVPKAAKVSTGMLVGASDDFTVDAAAASVTRYPPGMIEALEAMRSNHHFSEPFGIVDSLWLLPISPETIRPTAEARITALREL